MTPFNCIEVGQFLLFCCCSFFLCFFCIPCDDTRQLTTERDWDRSEVESAAKMIVILLYVSGTANVVHTGMVVAQASLSFHAPGLHPRHYKSGARCMNRYCQSLTHCQSLRLWTSRLWRLEICYK